MNIKCSLIVLTVWLLGLVLTPAQEHLFISGSQVDATIQVPEGADKMTLSTAKLLSHWVGKASGGELRVTKELPATSGIIIHVGDTPFVKSSGLRLDLEDEESSILQFEDGRNFVIAGASPWGTYYGALEFLERFVGIRWLMPGDSGVYLPQIEHLSLPKCKMRIEPTYISRHFSGLAKGAQKEWGVRMRLRSRIAHHHNLSNLFPAERYGTIFPNIFPLRDGKRFIPDKDLKSGWQPCFTEPDSVQIATRSIMELLRANPSLKTVSLGVNDKSGFCECSGCLPEEDNFLGRKNYSPVYYAWCNKVAETVARTNPDLRFGTLAYSEVAAAPGGAVRIHPNLFPYMTYDRYKWVDPRLKQEGQAETRRWNASSKNLGWYDYIYGSFYCLPRVHFHQMADYIRFGSQNGVKAYYAEAYPNWGEGPKLYLAAKLLWNPNLDVDQLLDEWYSQAVGPDAAPDLAKLYQLWEDYWMEVVPRSDWFTPKGQYLPFSVPSYLRSAPEDLMRKSRDLLLDVMAKTEKDSQFRKRAELIQQCFAFYQSSYYAYNGMNHALEVPQTSEAEALRVMEIAANAVEMKQRRDQWMDSSGRDLADFVYPIDFSRYPHLQGADWGDGVLWQSMNWNPRGKAVHNLYREFAGYNLPQIRQQAKGVLALQSQLSNNLLANPSFESTGEWPKEWAQWARKNVGENVISREAAKTAAQGVKVTGMERGGPYQTITVRPGQYVATCQYRSPRRLANAKLTMALKASAADATVLAQGNSTFLVQANGWTRVATGVEIPGTKAVELQLAIICHDFAAADVVFLDDAGLYKIQ